MKLTKIASGKQIVKLSKKDWLAIGKKAGWTKQAQLDANAIHSILKETLQSATNLSNNFGKLKQSLGENGRQLEQLVGVHLNSLMDGLKNVSEIIRKNTSETQSGQQTGFVPPSTTPAQQTNNQQAGQAGFVPPKQTA